MATNFGFNLLATAQTCIMPQEYQIQKWIGRTRNEGGYWIDDYDQPSTRKAGVYPLSNKQVMERGLDVAKRYIQIFDVQLVEMLDREKNADRIIYNGYYWQVQPSDNDWNESGGWNQVIAVRGDPVA